MKKGVFFDRDGTLIEDVPYISDPQKVRLLPGVKEALQLAQQKGYTLFLFTNQSGVARGLFPLQAVWDCNARMMEQLGGNPFTEYCIAPEEPKPSPIYRKPSPLFVLEMLEKYNLAPNLTWIVGDKWLDVQTGLNAGICSAYIPCPSVPLAIEERKALLDKKIPIFVSLLSFVGSLAV